MQLSLPGPAVAPSVLDVLLIVAMGGGTFLRQLMLGHVYKIALASKVAVRAASLATHCCLLPCTWTCMALPWFAPAWLAGLRLLSMHYQACVLLVE